MTAQIIPFVPRHAVTRKPMVEQAPTPALSLDSPLELLYETTLGYATWPEQHYVAPESDPA